jgi:hypothetical protein
LEQKQLVAFTKTDHLEKETAMLQASSRISDTELKVYVLDGSARAMYYDQSMTAQEVVQRLCLGSNVALFEVMEDIR